MVKILLVSLVHNRVVRWLTKWLTLGSHRCII